jgi:hypothetical protein
MKRKLFAVAVLALSWPAWQVAKSADVSVDFFYNNLSGGSWIEVADYGYCWQPDVVVSNTSWRPYSDGYWAYTDLGWTWVSYEDFGWATYHYGRWARLSDYGWVWVPGRDADLEWGPAWVSWRTGDQYVGWAPLPPETIGIVERGPISGAIDVEYDIGPAYYNFVDVRYIGEPVLRERIIDPVQNVTYIQQTTNVTNITYKNNVVYNYGPDVNVINARASRPIQRLRLERQEDADVATAVRSGALTKVQGDKLVVAAPMKIRRSARQVAPPAVKAKVAQAKIDRGWSVVGDENAKRQFKEKLRAQRAGAAAQAATGASPVAGARPPASPATAAAVSPGRPERAAGRRPNRAGTSVAASPTGSQGGGAAPAGAMSPTETTRAAERGKQKGRRGSQFQGAPAGAASPGGAGSSGQTTAAPERGKRRRGEMPAGATRSATAPARAPTAASESVPQAGAGRPRGRQLEQANIGARQGEAGAAAAERERNRQRGRGFEQAKQPAGGAPPSGGSQNLQGERQKGQAASAQPGRAASGAEAQKGQGQQQRGKARKGEAAPSASPNPR